MQLAINCAKRLAMASPYTTEKVKVCLKRPSCSHLGQCKFSSLFMSNAVAKHHRKQGMKMSFPMSLSSDRCKTPIVVKVFTLVMRFLLPASRESVDIVSKQ